MENKNSKKSIQYYIRCLHRDIGFIVIGLTIIYALSGILLTYRSTAFLKNETTVNMDIGKNVEAGELGKALKMRFFKIERQTEDTVYFNGGSYDKNTGMATYTQMSYPGVINKLIELHKLSSQNTMHIMAVVYAVLLLFLAVSPLFMYKPGARNFRRGIYLTIAGVVIAVIMMFTCGG